MSCPNSLALRLISNVLDLSEDHHYDIYDEHNADEWIEYFLKNGFTSKNNWYVKKLIDNNSLLMIKVTELIEISDLDFSYFVWLVAYCSSKYRLNIEEKDIDSVNKPDNSLT